MNDRIEDEDGGAAFPLGPSPFNNVQWGMSLRDWFAGQALAGLLNAGQGRCTSLASDAYQIADDMLEARK